jgi:hypothetical protein
MLTSPGKVGELVGAVQRSVILSDGWQLSTFAAQMSGLNASGIDFYTIPTLGEANIGGADVLRVDPDQVASFVSKLVTDEAGVPDTSSGSPVPGESTATATTGPTTGPTTTTAQPSGEGSRPALGLVTVDVRNGSNTRGLAATVLRTLTDRGFQGGAIGDAPVQSASTIRYPPGERTLAEYTADELGGQFTFLEDSSLTATELTVVLGTDFSNAPTYGMRAQPSSPPSSSSPSSSPPSSSPSSSSKPAPQINADGLNCVN